jgi:hypothetical protein
MPGSVPDANRPPGRPARKVLGRAGRASCRSSRPDARARRADGGLLAALLACLLSSGCGLLGGEDVGQRTADGGSASRTITVDELDQITKSFADRYVMLLANACDGIKQAARSPEQNRNAHRLKLAGATAAYDVATGPDPIRQLVDLAVVVELEKIVWVDEGQAARFFGADLSGGLCDALADAQEEIWALCTRAMEPDEIQALQAAVRAWRRANPGLEWIANIRFDAVAAEPDSPFPDEMLGTLSAPSGAITDSVGQARLLGQRTFYYLKRFPILLDWQSEAILEHALAVPESARLVQGLDSVLESAAGLLARLDQLASPSVAGDGAEVDPKLREIHLLLSEARELALSAREAAAAFAELLPRPPAVEPSDPSHEAAAERQTPPFDINEYTAASAQIAQAMREATTLIRETRSLAESGLALRQLEELAGGATEDIARRSHEAIDHAALRAAQLVLLTAVVFLMCTGMLFWLKSRGRTAARRQVP